ncbi:ABC transporter ATP-binding protein [Palleronia sp. LCG004]|uniref:ABC transporter ATP-binding protein n=1 Tax=Palleronia sp. LCG004 TaxID=3079304 RepID=UPI00294387E5|nr:ABC transporter ATP-binding protein [Palleronia sp. LCG004]WOI56438.1 ABC transporter ATP-binding protein [Palleronia sp. LCG004]
MTAEARSTAPLLRLEGVTKSYGSVHANRGVDLAVMPRSIHAILGENGAGKSTLMKMIYGIEMPDAGRIEWQGRTVAPASPAEARALGIGMVFQHFSLFDTLSVLENVALVVPGRARDLAARIGDLGRQYGLDVDPRAHVHALSVGERQRVEILRCLMLDPKLLILDEPTAVLPPQMVERLFATLRALRDRGVSILFISHKLDEIRALCDTATILRDGQVTGHADPRQTDTRSLATMMIGREMPAPLPVEAGVPGEARLELSALDVSSSDPYAPDLSGIDLSIRSGEIVGIAGISGNGQADLAAVISGERVLSRARSGAIAIDGQPVGHLGAAARRARGLAFVPEERLGRGAVPDMALWQNAILTAHDRGLARGGMVDRAAANRFAEDCIADFDVRTPGVEAEAGALSGGNLQKFVVGREIMLSPRILFVQQPTWGVDVAAAAAIRRRLVLMRNAGCAVLVISEEIEELFEICDRLHVLRDGRLSPSLPVAETSAEEIGEWMIGARTEDARV